MLPFTSLYTGLVVETEITPPTACLSIGGELDQHALEEQQPGERDDERRNVEPRDQGPLEVADSRGHARRRR